MISNRKSASMGRWIGAVALMALAAASAQAAEPLKVVGFVKVMEMGPMVTAAERMPGQVTIGNGGIPNLWPGVKDPIAPGATSAKGDVPDLAGNAETQALRQSVPHPDLRIILTIVDGNYRMMARKSSGIHNLSDLKGKRIATPVSTSAAFYLHKMLGRVGLTEQDVTVVPAAPDKGGDMLIAGTVDALAVWEPEPERARQALGDNAVEFYEFGVYREVYNLNATAATLADPVKRKQTVAFVRELIKSCHDATYNPARTQEAVAKNTGYPLKLVQDAWPHHHWGCDLPTDVLDVLTEEEQWLAAQDKRPARDRATLAKLIDPSILAEAQKQ